MKTSRKSVPVYLVIITTTMLFVGGWLLANTIQARAHTASTYYTKTWPCCSDPTYSFGKLDSPLNTTNAKNSIHSGDNEWDFNTDAWLEFNWNYVEDTSVYWKGGACSTAPSNGVWIITYNLSSLGNTKWCVTSTDIVKAVIRLDDVGTDWYTNSSTQVPSGKVDLRSVIVHEFGHAGGFGIGGGSNNNHFSGSSICSGESRQTMCSGIPSGTSYKRSLESHDEHTFASAY